MNTLSPLTQIIKLLIAFLSFKIFLSLSSFAQPVIANAEKYQAGDEFDFISIEIDSTKLLTAGANVTWDFSTAVAAGTDFQMVVEETQSTQYAQDFPNSNIVEIGNDGSFVFSNQTDSLSLLEGYITAGENITINYPKPQTFMVRPLTYLDSFEATYTNNFNASNYDFSGAGFTKIVADGYGTLKLPNEDFNNVLRIKIEQTQYDTLLTFGTVSKTISTTYVWFQDGQNAPLMRVSHFSGDHGSNLQAHYLKQEISTSIKDMDLFPIDIYPNPSRGRVKLQKDRSHHFQAVHVFNSLGQILEVEMNDIGDAIEMNIDQISGDYFIQVITDKAVKTERIKIIN